MRYGALYLNKKRRSVVAATSVNPMCSSVEELLDQFNERIDNALYSTESNDTEVTIYEIEERDDILLFIVREDNPLFTFEAVHRLVDQLGLFGPGRTIPLRPDIHKAFQAYVYKKLASYIKKK